MSEFRSFVAEKELEWKAALNQQVSLLEESLAARESELRAERQMAAQLKEDFKYNIRLVTERDSELAALERENALLKQQCQALEDKLTGACVRLDECQQRLAEESHARARLADEAKSGEDSHERELQLLRHERDLEMSRARDEQQALRRQLEMESVRSRKELELQKRELAGAFDSRAEELQDAYQLRAGELERALMDCELKCDLLGKDNASLQKARLGLLGRLETGENQLAALEKQLQESDARYQSDIAVQENERERLQELLASVEAGHSAAVDRLTEKLAGAQADSVRGRELADTSAAKLREDRLALRRQTAELVAKLHEAEASFQRKVVEFESAAHDKDLAIQRLNGQLDDLQTQLTAAKSGVGRLFVDKDAEIDRLRRLADTATEELNNRRADVDRYKREAESAMQRETELESRRQQMELDYQRKLGELETLQYEKSETYIERLSAARNEALLQLDELKTTLAQKQTFIQSLLKDREAATLALREHGISLDRRLESKTVEHDQLAESERRAQELTVQNETLREIVKQMRQEMEAFGGGANPKQPPPAPAGPLADVRSIQELSNLLAKLRADKTDLLAQCRKQQARIGHLEARATESLAEQTAADTAAEQLRYQLAAQDRHHATEAAGLKRRLQELEAQLDESQREADEYYKANIEQGRLAERLQQDVLTLRARAAAQPGKPGEVNFGAQELYIQQLQNEIEELRGKIRARHLYGDAETDGTVGGNASELVAGLRAKLKLAANQVKKLAQENQSLVDLSNRLRAELKRSAEQSGKRRQPSQVPAPAGQPIELEAHARRAVNDAVGGMSEKLRELERMQYYLTREELARQNAAAASGAARQQRADLPGLGDSQPVKDTGLAAYRRAEGLPSSSAAATAAVGIFNRESLNLSSVGGGGESMREVWQLLDDAEPAAAAPARDPAAVAGRNQALTSLLQVRPAAKHPAAAAAAQRRRGED